MPGFCEQALAVLMQPNDSPTQARSDQESPDQEPPDQELPDQELPDQELSDQDVPSQKSLDQKPLDQKPLDQTVSSQEQPSPKQTSPKQTSPERPKLSEPSVLTPVETLQKRYADQLSQDIEQLEEQKSKLRDDIQTLTRAHTRLQASVDSLRQAERSASRAADAAKQRLAEGDKTAARDPKVSNDQLLNSEFVRPVAAASPRLPGEPDNPKRNAPLPTEQRPAHDRSAAGQPGSNEAPSQSMAQSTSKSIELPIPATSAQRRQLSIQTRRVDRADSTASEKKGLILSAIATLLMAWHFCAIATLGTGGSWLGTSIGALGVGFVPAVALLWLRMLVVVPCLVVLAPQLHEEVWDDLRDWVYGRDGLLLSLIVSGVALFISQALLYQCLGLLGPTIGAALIFLYPLLVTPLSAAWPFSTAPLSAPWRSGSAYPQHRKLSALGGVALVAIAMGGILTLKPLLDASPTALSAIWLGILASGAFSLYILLTNISYRQPKCHPIPAGIVQFGVVAALSSIVLLVRPLEPAEIDWLSFALWGLLLGFLMLLVYLLNYSSLRLIGPRTAMIAALAPLLTILIAKSFSPNPGLAIIQWTGIALISLGGIAFGKEKLGSQ